MVMVWGSLVVARIVGNGRGALVEAVECALHDETAGVVSCAETTGVPAI